MRTVWLAMRDEEPPGRGMAELLAAARVKAEAMAPRPSRWRRLVAALRRPPVLALATVVVLIGGAVLLGRRLLEGEMQTAPAVAPVRAPVSTGSGSPSAATAGAVSDEPHAGAGDAGKGRAALEQAPQAAAPRDAAVRAAETQRPTSLVTTPPGHAGPRREAPAPDVGMVTRFGPAADGARARLYQQCEAAARRGDCPEVRRLVEQIGQTDPGYRARVVQDAAFARCLE